MKYLHVKLHHLNHDLLKSFEESVNLLLVGDKKLKKYILVEVKNEIY